MWHIIKERIKKHSEICLRCANVGILWASIGIPVLSGIAIFAGVSDFWRVTIHSIALVVCPVVIAALNFIEKKLTVSVSSLSQKCEHYEGCIKALVTNDIQKFVRDCIGDFAKDNHFLQGENDTDRITLYKIEGSSARVVARWSVNSKFDGELNEELKDLSGVIRKAYENGFHATISGSISSYMEGIRAYSSSVIKCYGDLGHEQVKSKCMKSSSYAGIDVRNYNGRVEGVIVVESLAQDMFDRVQYRNGKLRAKLIDLAHSLSPVISIVDQEASFKPAVYRRMNYPRTN